jgi:RNA polymerase sigma-B factor
VGLRAQLVEVQLPLAMHVAQRFRGRREAMDDLEQVAALALVKAIDRYDPSRGVPFASFAVPTIVGELKRHFRDRSWSVRVPRGLKDRWVRVTADASELAQELGRSPTVRELAARASLREDQVVEALHAGGSLHPLSFYAENDADDDASAERDVLAVDDASLDRSDDRDVLRRLMGALDTRERAIVYLRFFRGLTQSEIAGRIGISQMHVSRLLQRSLRKLRDAATGAEVDDGPG